MSISSPVIPTNGPWLMFATAGDFSFASVTFCSTLSRIKVTRDPVSTSKLTPKPLTLHAITGLVSLEYRMTATGFATTLGAGSPRPPALSFALFAPFPFRLLTTAAPSSSLAEGTSIRFLDTFANDPLRVALHSCEPCARPCRTHNRLEGRSTCLGVC